MRRASAGKNVVLGVVALALLGAAGWIGWSKYTQNQAATQQQAAFDGAAAWRTTAGRALAREGKWNRVNIEIPEQDPDVEQGPVIRIVGAVPTEADLDALRQLIAATNPPVPVEYVVRVEP